ncbi:MAG TPA: D-alanine--D-alanine ligase, partial [Phycisphaerales bacterium]|nr:D-alanine--D-alanine ligase [Phycisphaerales bacterium]
ALAALGHEPLTASATLALDAVVRTLERERPALVFNLVESLSGRGALIHLVPMVLDALRVPYTGCPAHAVYATSNKLIAKRRLRDAGLPTPGWFEVNDAEAPIGERRWIIKSVWEHASVGLDEDSVIAAAHAGALRAEVSRRLPALGGEGFAEEFIEGREFNLSLISQRSGPVVLPPAEIVFEGYAPGRPRVVGYRAKWDPSSDAYHATPRRFDFPPTDAALLGRLRALALECWSAFALRGYARVDFRVDESGEPWVLEVNTNPCLSSDAGFAAAASRAGIDRTGVVRAIVEASA